MPTHASVQSACRERRADARRALRRTIRRVAALQREASWQPDDAPGSWVWCWRQFARAVLSANCHRYAHAVLPLLCPTREHASPRKEHARHAPLRVRWATSLSVALTGRCGSPAGLANADVDGVAHLVLAGTWAWCWELFVRGVLSLDRRPRMRPRLGRPPQVVGSVAGIRPASFVGYSPSPPAAVSIVGEDDRADVLVEIRKLARPDPPYRWLGDSPRVPGDRTLGDSRIPTAAEQQVLSNGRLPDGSGSVFLAARHVSRHHSNAAAERLAVERWTRG